MKLKEAKTAAATVKRARRTTMTRVWLDFSMYRGTRTLMPNRCVQLACQVAEILAPQRARTVYPLLTVVYGEQSGLVGTQNIQRTGCICNNPQQSIKNNINLLQLRRSLQARRRATSQCLFQQWYTAYSSTVQIDSDRCSTGTKP